jgi:uncharacterized membrane protein
VVGDLLDANGYWWAFLKAPDQDMQNLGTLEEGIGSNGRGVNNSGVGGADLDFRGWWAFLKNPDEVMQNLGAIGGIESNARHINNNGQVV